MPSKRELMARLYAKRVKDGECVVCTQPASPFIYCEDCRADKAQWMRSHRCLTTLNITAGLPHTST